MIDLMAQEKHRTLETCPVCEAPLRSAEWDRHTMMCVILNVGSEDGTFAGERPMTLSEVQQYEEMHKRLLESQNAERERRLKSWRERFNPPS